MPLPIQSPAAGAPLAASLQPSAPNAAPPASDPIVEVAPPSSGQTRLVIEQDARSGAFVYKTVDPLSQEVLSQYPSDELLALKERAEYQPGALVQQSV